MEVRNVESEGEEDEVDEELDEDEKKEELNGVSISRASMKNESGKVGSHQKPSEFNHYLISTIYLFFCEKL